MYQWVTWWVVSSVPCVWRDDVGRGTWTWTWGHEVRGGQLVGTLTHPGHSGRAVQKVGLSPPYYSESHWPTRGAPLSHPRPPTPPTPHNDPRPPQAQLGAPAAHPGLIAPHNDPPPPSATPRPHGGVSVWQHLGPIMHPAPRRPRTVLSASSAAGPTPAMLRCDITPP